MEKQEARRAIREAVARLTPQDRECESRAVSARVMALPEMARARTVMVFISMPDEVDTAPIIQRCLDAGKAVVAPRTRMRPRRMVPCRLRRLDALRPGAYGILEPPPDEPSRPEDIDLALVPAVGLDRGGARLGRGAGYYDRFLTSAGFKAVRVGVGFQSQLVDRVPRDEHDMPVEIIVTANETLRPGPR